LDSVGGELWTGTIIGNATFESGQISFSGGANSMVGSYLQIGRPQMYSVNVVTIEMWVSLSKTNSKYARIFQIGSPTTTSPNVQCIRSDISGKICCRNAATSSDPLMCSAIPFNGTTAHIMLVADGGFGTISLYVNGTLALSWLTWTSIKGSGVAEYGSFFGQPYLASDVNPTTRGSIDEIRIWSGALTAEDALINYQLGPDHVRRGALASFPLPSLDSL
jgi:hypothetical protein